MSETAPLMVGVSGLRGIVGKSLTPEVAARFAGAFGTWLNERDTGGTVVIGRDGRAGGEAIHGAAIGALTTCGLNVIDIGIAMTPTVGVMTDHLGADGGMVVTASHNPQEWNGLKCLVRTGGPDQRDIDTAAPSARAAKEIIAIFESGRTWKPAGTTGRVGESAARVAAQQWHHELVIRGLRSEHIDVPLGASFRVALDSVNGAGAEPGAGMLATLGCHLDHLGRGATGVFSHPPEPTRENLVGLCAAVKEHRSDVGFAQDPDADRLAIVDERGEYIGEEYTLALAAEALLEDTEAQRHAGTKAVLVTNLSTSRMLDDVAARHGARVVRTAVGEANVVEAMKREAAAGNAVVLGGEGNGGVIWPKVTYVRDSLSAMGLVLGLMARRKQTLSEIVASMPSYAIEKRKVDLARKEDASPAVEKLTATYKAHRVDLQDGVRVDFEHGPLAGKAWLHVRASNTEPIMRLIAEAPTAEAAKRVLDEAAGVIG